MSETETLTLSQQREQKKEARRKVRIERDGALHQVRTVYEPQILKLKNEWKEAVLEIEKNCDEELAKIK